MRLLRTAAFVVATALLTTPAFAHAHRDGVAFLLSEQARSVDDRYHIHHRHHHHTARRRATHVTRTVLAAHDRVPGPHAGDPIVAMVTDAAVAHGLPVRLAHGIVRVESGYNCHAYNHGAQGVMQVKAASARSVGINGGLTTCAGGLEAGMRYLKLAYVAAHGDWARTATLYNMGLAARPVATSYSRSVMRLSRL